MRLSTGLGGGDCGFDFEVGKQYLVYAFKARPANYLQTSVLEQRGWKRAAGIQLIFAGSAWHQQRTKKRRLQQASYVAESFRPTQLVLLIVWFCLSVQAVNPRFQIAKPDLIVMAPFASQTSIRASIIYSS
jgi:hypothetical protein